MSCSSTTDVSRRDFLCALTGCAAAVAASGCSDPTHTPFFRDHLREQRRRALADVGRAGQDRDALRRECGNVVDNPEAFLGAELAAIGEVLCCDLRCAAGVKIAMLAGQVAAISEVPGNNVRPGE